MDDDIINSMTALSESLAAEQDAADSRSLQKLEDMWQTMQTPPLLLTPEELSQAEVELRERRKKPSSTPSAAASTP